MKPKTPYTKIGLLLVTFLLSGLLYGQDEWDITFTVDDLHDSEEETVDLSVIRVTDPAGHSCCVDTPPPKINLFLNNGSLNISQLVGESLIPWLSFGPMSVDSNLEFRGESRSTVAGFANILTTISGQITAKDKISAEIKVGADGGLPQGEAIFFDVEFKPELVLGFLKPISDTQEHLSLETAAVNLGDISIEEREYPPASGLDLFISINVGTETADADWWIVMQDNSKESDNLFYFDLALGKWTPGFAPTHQGPLMSVPEPFKLLDGYVPDSNDFVIVFGVDREQNGVFDQGVASVIGHRYRTGL